MVRCKAYGEMQGLMVRCKAYGEMQGLWWDARLMVRCKAYGEMQGLWRDARLNGEMQGLWWDARFMVRCKAYAEMQGLMVRCKAYGEMQGLWWDARLMVRCKAYGEMHGLWWDAWLMVRCKAYGEMQGLWWDARLNANMQHLVVMRNALNINAHSLMVKCKAKWQKRKALVSTGKIMCNQAGGIEILWVHINSDTSKRAPWIQAAVRACMLAGRVQTFSATYLIFRILRRWGSAV